MELYIAMVTADVFFFPTTFKITTAAGIFGFCIWARFRNTGQELILSQDDERPKQEVKSTAVVKYASAELPQNFSRLSVNTNINIPPSNWLRQNSKMEQHIRDFSWGKEHSDYSSVHMANNALDLSGEVDVISNAKNIKKLLKIPFGKSHVSMMVHRIGKTLLLDEFDIHKHLLRQEKEDWKWLRQFYYQCVANDMQEKMKCVPRKNKSRDTLRNRNMFSKFLYHSIGEEDMKSSLLQNDRSPPHVALSSQKKEHHLIPDPLPEPKGKEFHRELLWTFEDIKMLIGTDLPIFGGGSYPCVSLRLRDSTNPINVLTGLDYWLDNLMCNVPEVAMCFHVNGIVQNYELTKTEDIPNLENSKFDPQLVTDIAKNILSFLKTKATKEGHTYWLYKGIDDDVVKLYDLTTLCDSETEDSTANPFTVPVGMLLYRVARNILQTGGSNKTATIRTLLEGSLQLLNEDTHSQVCTSSNYLMSDIYVPDSSLRDVWSSVSGYDSDEESEENNISVEDNKSQEGMAVDLKTLCLPNPKKDYKTQWDVIKTKPVNGSTDWRCQQSLTCIKKGLDCLARDLTASEREPAPNIVEEQAHCDRDDPIPMHYESVRKLSEENLQIALSSQKSKTSWHRSSKALLMRKASITFCAMAKSSINIHSWGQCLRHLKSAFTCFASMKTLMKEKAEESRELLTTLLGLSGDTRLMLSKCSNSWDEHISDYNMMPDVEMEVLESAQQELSSSECEYHWCCRLTKDRESNLIKSHQCYEESLRIAGHVKNNQEAVLSLRKRMGNMYNELGVFYMLKAQDILQKESPALETDKIEKLCHKSQSFFETGIDLFEKIRDIANIALLHSNRGKLMRLCAQAYTQDRVQLSRPEFTATEEQYYLKATECYRQALFTLKNSSNHKDISRIIAWELSTTYFNMAVLLQDHAPLSRKTQDQVEKSVTDLMNKSLKYCGGDDVNDKQPTYRYRAGTINHRLASLYHNSYRSELSEQRKKFLRQLAEMHYEKSIVNFECIDSYLEWFRVELERVAMSEYYFQGQKNVKVRLKILSGILQYLVDCRRILEGLQNAVEDTQVFNMEEAEKLTSILESRMQFTMLELVKHFSAQRKNKQGIKEVIDELKLLYARSLKTSDANLSCESEYLKQKWQYIMDYLEAVKEFQMKLQKDLT